MSEESDEDLIGDVDFDLDFEDVKDMSSCKPTGPASPGKELPEKEKGKGEYGNSEKQKQTTPVPKKQIVKKTATVKPPSQGGDDLLLAFSVGLPSVKKVSPYGSGKRKTEESATKRKVKEKSMACGDRNISTSYSVKGNSQVNVKVIVKKVEVTNTRPEEPLREGKDKAVLTKQPLNDAPEEKKLVQTGIVEGMDSCKENFHIKQEVTVANTKQGTNDIDIKEEIKLETDVEIPTKQNETKEIHVTGVKEEIGLKTHAEIPNQKKATVSIAHKRPDKEMNKSKEVVGNKSFKASMPEKKTGSDKDRLSMEAESVEKGQTPQKAKEIRNEENKSKSDATEKKPETSCAEHKRTQHLSKSAPVHNQTNPSKETEHGNEKQLNEKSPSTSKPALSPAPNAEVKVSMSSVKRKAEDLTNDSSSAKVRKEETVKSETPPTPSHEGKTDAVFSEEDYKAMDNFFADEMLNSVRDKRRCRPGVKYSVQVSPLEISDLAQASVHQLIKLHPSTVLVFKRQAVKFKKKKGYAEATFSTMTELKEFVYQLTQIKVCEKKIDVLITALRPNQTSDVLSLVIHLNRNAKLLKLVDSSEDPMINNPMSIGEKSHHVKFDKVVSSANAAFMHSMFPFTNNVIINKSRVGKETNPFFWGPVSVCYISPGWMEAVMDCCTDFTINGFPLTLVSSSSSEIKPHSKKTSSTVKETKHIGAERTEFPVAEEGVDADCDNCDDDDDDDDDDLVSRMTRDVCLDMLETIKQLKELKSNNPKINKMQEQLKELQKSLAKPRSSLSDKPYTPSASASRPSEAELKDEHTRDGSSTTPEVKKRKQAQNVEEIFEELQQAELQKENDMKHQQEEEAKKQREQTMNKKSQWARKVILDYKQEGVRGEKVSKEAERFLREREKRLKEKDQEERRIAEVERMRAEKMEEEEERLRQEQQKREQELKKEAERQELIQKIEEARLKDSKKAEKFSASMLMWNPDSGGTRKKSPVKSSPHSSGKRKILESDQSSKRRSSAPTDQGIDKRLADFEHELAQQGKIEKRLHPPYVPTPKDKESGSHYKSLRIKGQHHPVVMEEEYEDLYAQNELHRLPANYRVCLNNMVNRNCPVPDCPAKNCFRNKEAFVEHWSIFHTAETTMRFCQNCSAYFMNLEELENHIMRHHRLSSREATALALSARVKVIPNPSFRDPSPFLSPSLS